MHNARDALISDEEQNSTITHRAKIERSILLCKLTLSFRSSRPRLAAWSRIFAPRGLIILCAAGKRGDSGEVARENAHSYRPVTFRR